MCEYPIRILPQKQYVKRIDIPAKDLLPAKLKTCQEKCGKTYRYSRAHIWFEQN